MKYRRHTLSPSPMFRSDVKYKCAFQQFSIPSQNSIKLCYNVRSYTEEVVMERLLDPKNDWAFKQVFGQEKNKAILIHFLNDMLDEHVLHGDLITNVYHFSFYTKHQLYSDVTAQFQCLNLPAKTLHL